MANRRTRFLVFTLLVFTAAALFPTALNAATTITVKTVPWVATNPLIPHDTWAGKTITLKGTASIDGVGVQYIWDFGDGSSTSGAVTNRYVIEATHAYAATIPVGSVIVATLTVTNTNTGDTGSAKYYIAMQSNSQAVQVNVAIDEGLWELHRTQCRGTSCYSDPKYDGTWRTWSHRGGVLAANLNAFEVNGHLETGSADNPYTDTVQRTMRRLFTLLDVTPIGLQTAGNPDTNGNGYGVYARKNLDLGDDDYVIYQTGMFMDAIVASGTPTAVAPTGPANIAGRTYKDIVQDMVDLYAYCQADSNWGSMRGGWRYSCNSDADQSVCQWAAIGMLAAERNWGIAIPAFVKSENLIWLGHSQDGSGIFYYQPWWLPWGERADIVSGMVQLVLDDKGRGYVGSGGYPNWDLAETYVRNHWFALSDFFYGMFSFTKAMLLHTPPITMLHASSGGLSDIDWYHDANGVANRLVSTQRSDGSWWYMDPGSSELYPFETAWAIMMLNKSIFESGAPVAVAKATPNPAVATQTITLDGSASYHQDPTKSIVSWSWDLNNDGTCETAGVTATKSYPAVGNYPVKLCVTDNSSPAKTAVTTLTIVVSTPPLAPTANAGGPYLFFCTPTVGTMKWFLDGSASANPDEGQHQPGSNPPDTIYPAADHFKWDLFNNATFLDRSGDVVDVTGAWPTGSYIVQLKVCDTTAASFPAAGANLCSVSSSQVKVNAVCPPCATLGATSRNASAALTWKNSNHPHHYNVYRSTVSGGPYKFVKSVSSTSTIDIGLTNGTTYYYVIREAQANNAENCQSNEAAVRPTSGW